MEEREPPPPGSAPPPTEGTPLDPAIYSLGPNAAIPEESFDETEDVRAWNGGSSDFSLEEDEVISPVQPETRLPPSEVLEPSPDDNVED